MVDLATGDVTVLSDRGRWEGGGNLSGDGHFAAFEEMSEVGTTTSVVVELATGKRVFQLPFDENSAAYAKRGRTESRRHAAPVRGRHARPRSPADRPTLVYEIARGPAAEPVAQLPGLDGEILFAKFDPTGRTWYQTSRDGTLRRWDPSTGRLLSTWPAVGSGRPSVAADGRTVLVSLFASPTAVLVDTGAKGDLGQVQTCDGFISAGSLHVRNGLAAFLEDCSGVGDGGKGVTQVIDVQGRTLLASRPGWWAQDLAISPDGGSFVSQEAKAPGLLGPLMVAALRTGSPVVELKDLCWYDQTSVSMPAYQQPGCSALPADAVPVHGIGGPVVARRHDDRRGRRRRIGRRLIPRRLGRPRRARAPQAPDPTGTYSRSSSRRTRSVSWCPTSARDKSRRCRRRRGPP